MKKVLLFHFESCPFCRYARRWVEEALTEDSDLQALDIELIDEQLCPGIASQYDYWYVPCFYVEGQKMHEGVCTKKKVAKILRQAL